MKKKILSLLLSVCILATTFTTCFSVFAADAPTYDVDVNADGKTVTVTVTLPGTAGVAGGNCTLQYNNQKLSFAGTVEQFGANVVNPNYKENAVRFSFAQATAIKANTVLWKMQFTIKNGIVSADDFTVTEFRLYNENSQVVSTDETSTTAVNFSCTHAETEVHEKNTVCKICGEVVESAEVPPTNPEKPANKRVKLVWANDASNLEVSNIGNFDFRAILTTGGVADEDQSNVKYVYTGIFYISSEPPTKPGFYVQTAWTKAFTKYAFPITRSFKIAK